MKALAADYKDRAVALVAISPNDPKALRLDELGYTDVSDSFEEMKIRAREHQFNFPYLYDGDSQEVSKAYGPAATPHVFVFDQERKLRYVGRVDDAENPERVTSHDARNAIEALLEGRPVPVEKTKTFGCSIKWADKRPAVDRAFERWAKEEVTLERIGSDALEKVVRNNTENLRFINVWATWCGPCVAEFPELVAINRMYRNRNFEMVTVSADDPEKYDQALAFLKKQEASTTNYLFRSPDKYELIELMNSEWAGNLPYTMIVKPGGEVMFRHAGIIDPLKVKQAVIGYLGRYYFSNQ